MNPIPKAPTNADYGDTHQSPSPDEPKTCAICLKPFNFRRRKHHCQLCSRVVCREHSQKKKLVTSPEPADICDDCDQNIIKQEIRYEIDSEISKLNEDILKAKEQNGRLTREQINKTSELNRLETDLKLLETEFKLKEQNMKRQLIEEQARGENIKEEIERVRHAKDESTRNEEELNNKCRNIEGDLVALKKQTAELKTRKGELSAQLDRIHNRLHTSLSVEQVISHLCTECNVKVQEAYAERMPVHNALDDGDSFLQSNKSILDTIEEMNQHPRANKSDCRII